MNVEDGFINQLETFLPTAILDRLRSNVDDRNVLRDVIQHLNSLQRAVISYLPLYIAEDETLLSREHYASLRSGAFLFADVSGFTALSEQLQEKHEGEGTEILTAVINDYFAKMLEVLANSDGQLLKFAGDALLAFWTADSDDTLAACYKAIRTGLRMQRAMQEHFQPIQHRDIRRLFGEDHQAQLTMSIGIARGKLLETLVGSRKQRDHLIIGQLPGDAMQAEGAGDQDEVIVSADLAQAVRDEFPMQRELEGGFVQIVDDPDVRLDAYELELPVRRRAKTTALFDMEQASLKGQLETVLKKVRAVSPYVPQRVLHELVNSKDYDLDSAHRPTVTMFVHCTGFAELLEAWGDSYFTLITQLMGRCYRIIQQIVDAREGTLTRTDPYKLGTKLLITFGAPLKHPDDPVRAIAAALEMNLQLAKFNASISEQLPKVLRRDVYIMHRIGVTQGETYAGEVGWKQRREYTVMGDDVNLAARLMASADYGQILISQRVHELVQYAFSTTALLPLVLKGKRKPVPVYRVESLDIPTASADFSSEMPFIGHDMFMLSLSMTLKQAVMGRRRAVALVGDAGIGKTRIARQLAEMAVEAGYRVAWATCLSLSDSRTTWVALVEQLLDLNRKEPQTARRQLEGCLKELNLNHLMPPLSNLLFGDLAQHHSSSPKPVAAPDPDESYTSLMKRFEQMSVQERKNSGLYGLIGRRVAAQPQEQTTGMWKTVERRTSLPEALAQFILAYTQKHPTLLLIDDLHLENKQALELLKYVLKQVTQAKLVILLTYEPDPNKALDLGVQTLVVPDLSRDETDLVAMAILHASELGPRLSDLLWERTSGRPLFIESLLRTLLGNGFIEDVNGCAELRRDANVDALPENVRELVISRADSLDPAVKQVLNGAAVLGEDFSAEALDAVCDTGGLIAMKDALAKLLEVQLLIGPQSGSYRFRHGMAQSVIYETLARAQRTKLHYAAASYWRRQTSERARPITLAYHLLKCGQLPQAIETVTTAAEQAEQAQDIEGALELYTHALAIFPDEKNIQSQLERLRALQSGD